MIEGAKEERENLFSPSLSLVFFFGSLYRQCNRKSIGVKVKVR